MTGPRARATTRVAPASPALLALLVAAAVLLMHAMASTSGCTAGQPAPPSMMAGPVAAPAPAHPLWTDRQDAGGGQVCVSLPAAPAWTAILALLLVAAGARFGDPGQPRLRRQAPVWRAPPVSGTTLLTRIGVSRS